MLWVFGVAFLGWNRHQRAVVAVAALPLPRAFRIAGRVYLPFLVIAVTNWWFSAITPVWVDIGLKGIVAPVVIVLTVDMLVTLSRAISERRKVPGKRIRLVGLLKLLPPGMRADAEAQLNDFACMWDRDRRQGRPVIATVSLCLWYVAVHVMKFALMKVIDAMVGRWLGP